MQSVECRGEKKAQGKDEKEGFKGSMGFSDDM